MKPVYTIEDFKTRAGRKAFELCHPLVDYDLLNRFEPKDPTSAADEFASIQDKHELYPHMSRYQSTLEKPKSNIVLPSGGIVTPDELGNLCKTMVNKSYMDAHHDFEEVFTRFKKGEELYDIFLGRKPFIGIQKFVTAVATCPTEATFIRMEINNPVLKNDEELYVAAREQAEDILMRTSFKAPDGKTIQIPPIGPDQGPRVPALSEKQLQALANIWVTLDTFEQSLFDLYVSRLGGMPDSPKPN